MRDRGRLILLLAGLGTVAGPAAAPHAAEPPELHIRAHSRVSLREVGRSRSKDGYRLSVSVKLGDSPDSAAAPPQDEPPVADEAARSFAGQSVVLRIDSVEEDSPELGRQVALSMDKSGSASFRFGPLPSGRYRLRADYSGDGERDAGSDRLVVDLDRSPAELRLELPPSLGLHEALPVGIELRRDGQPLSAAVRLQVGTSPPESYQLDGGRHREVLRLRPEPTAGSLLVVRAHYAGDADTAAADLVRPLLITTRAELSLEELRAPRRRSSSRERAEPPSPLPLEVAQGSRLRLGGSLRDETGPLGGELVDIEASGGGERRLLGSAVTDFFGHFELTVDKLLLPIGSGFITARLTPTPTPRHRHVRPGPTPELALQVLPPEPLSLLYFLLPLGSSGLGWLLWRGGRLIAARLAAWRLARRQRDGRLSPLAPSSRTPQGPAAAGEAGVTLGSRSPRPTLTLRRTVDSAIDGAVHDAVFGPSLPSASLHILPLASGAPLEDVQVDSQGQFRIAALPAGRYVLRASAPGYLSEEFAATIPHRGELRAITIRLMPLRARIHAEWQRVANAYYSDELRQQTGTPRELLDEATAPRPTAPAATASPLHSPSPAELERLQRLTALVEQSYYSPRLCTKEMLSEAERLAAALSRPGSSPPLTSDPRDGLRAPSAPRPPGPIAPPR